MADLLGHTATARVDAPAEAVFAFLADPLRLGGWSLGCMETRAADRPGLFTGVSLFDGARGWFAIDADPDRMLIDYRVGTPDALTMRISARVLPGESLGLPAGSSVFSLTAWRTAAMDDERWRRLCATHEAEVFLIRAQIESGTAAQSATIASASISTR